MAMTMAQASAAMREAMRETVKKYSTWYLLEGVFLVIAGIVALIYPHIASVALVFVLCVLSLSEVIIAYSWSVLLSRVAGIPKLLFELGFMDSEDSWFPGFWAVLCGLTYFNVPLAILVLYPQSTRLDRELTEAAQTLGASPIKTFWTVVIPLLWKAILACFILLFVFTMGAYVTPLWLGEPENTMYAQLIANQMLSRNNAPFAAALGVFLVVVTLSLVGITFWLGRERSPVAGARR